MKLLVFSLLLGAAWAQTQDSAEPPQDNANGTEVGEGANEASGEDVEKATGKWQTYYCRSFMFQSSAVSWAHAQQRCLALGGNLATIHTSGEERFVKGIAEGKTAWIGLSDAQMNGFWFWINSSPLKYTNWCPGEPNNDRSQHCVQINYSGNRCWDDVQCYESLPFVCERK
uniref:C-type lectin domain-containing protein n=1 Tax=Neogobius melanostomus TaxID=47308 RepID=A0A8C6TCA9_9GOBI